MAGNNNIFYDYNYNNYFVETGSYYGKGIQWAIDAGFKNIISIEITPKYYDLCVEKFKDNKNVNVFFGDSVKLLPFVVNDINEPITFWLDAHYTESTTLYGDKKCPLIEELEIIKSHVRKFKDTILIDDLRCFKQNS